MNIKNPFAKTNHTMGDPSFGLVTALGDADKDVRYMAARTLEAVGTNAASAIPALEAAQADPDTMVSNAVARALLKISGEVGR